MMMRVPTAIAVCFFVWGCNTTRSVPAGDQLYTGARLSLDADSIAPRDLKVLKADLVKLVRPRPNSRFLGIPFKLGFYNLFAGAKEKSLFGKLRNSLGEPPVLLSQLDLENDIKLLQTHLENKGFFRASVTGDTVVKGKKSHAEFTAKGGSQYKISSVAYLPDSSAVSRDITAVMGQSILKKGEPYDLDVIRGERIRIDADLKEKGYYYFSPELLKVQVDSVEPLHTVDTRVVLKPEASEAARNPQRIHKVYIYTGYNIKATAADTSKRNAVAFEGYNIIDRRQRFKPKMFRQVMQFKPGDLYNRTDHNQTLNRLINLDEFKYVQNRFEPSDSGENGLDAYYYLTPKPKKSLRAELGFVTKSNNLNGVQLNFSFRNRNTFGAGEQLSVTAYVGSETQFGGSFQGYNTYRTGAEANLAIPRFVIPFFDIRTQGNFVPRTNIQLGYDILTRQKLYTLNQFRGALGYVWRTRPQVSHELYPVSITYVQPINVTGEYRDSIAKYPFLDRIVDSQFVLGSTYQYNYNELVSGLRKRNAFYFNGLVDVSGNIAGLATGAKKGEPKRLFGALFDQYLKLEGEGRWYRRLGLNSSFVNRAIVGVGLPYGNSTQLPFIKQYFAGGNNSIRAFRSRSLGPGTYRQINAGTFLGDQTGDIRLELNTEWRPHISGPLYGAVFLDAGNIWLVNEDTTRPGGKFTGDFLKQLAIGTGVGIRLDIQLFVIRLDLGIPLRKPWEEKPLVINQIDLLDRAYRKENLIFNLAIGYPF